MENSQSHEDLFDDDDMNAVNDSAGDEPTNASQNVSNPSPDRPQNYLGYIPLNIRGTGNQPASITLQFDQDLTPFASSNDPATKCWVESGPLITSDTNADLTQHKLSEFVSVATENPFNNNITNKRRRHSSDDDEDVEKLPKKTAKYGPYGEIKTHKVTFTLPPSSPLQNNENNKEATPAPTEDAADNNQPGPSKTRERVKILPAAEPMWVAARRHRGMEQKCKLRADFHTNLLAQGVTPGQFLGADKISRYFLKDGALPTPLAEMIQAQAKLKTELAIQLLQEEQMREKNLADYYTKVTQDLYQQEGVDSYAQAEELMVSLCTHYRGIEKKRLDALTKKELARKASSPKDLAQLVCKDSDFPAPSRNPSSTKGPAKRAPTRSRSPARDNKRQAAPNNRGKPTPAASGRAKPTSRSKSPKPGPSGKGKSGANASKGKGKAQPKGRGTSGRSPKPQGQISEGTLRVLDALEQLTKELKK